MAVKKKKKERTSSCWYCHCGDWTMRNIMFFHRRRSSHVNVASPCSISRVFASTNWVTSLVVWVNGMDKWCLGLGIWRKGRNVLFYTKIIYYFKYSCICINLPYMPTVFGIGSLKIIILYVKYGMNDFNLDNALFYMTMVLYKVYYFIC